MVYKCDSCNTEFSNLNDVIVHRLEVHGIQTFIKCDQCDCKFHDIHEYRIHLRNVHNSNHSINQFEKARLCGLPKPIYTESESRKFSERIHKPTSEEVRKKISESMKKAHAEGRAHNIGECTWNNDKSYPEKWFTTVIENEFTDKNYEYNFQVGHFKLDFAWPKKMRYIEIDGDQHYRFSYNIDKDKRRSTWLAEQGWTELRLSWSYISSHKDECIQSMKSFIDDVSDLPLELQYRDKRKEYFIELSNRRLECIKAKERELLELKDKILSSGIDISKLGWKLKVSKSLGVRKGIINKVCWKFHDDFKDAYKKKSCSLNNCYLM